MFTKQRKIEYLRLLIFIGFVSAVVFHYLQGVIGHKGFPLNTFLNGEELYGDFLNSYPLWPKYHFTGIGYGWSYFPAAYLLIHLFTLIENGFFAANVFLLIFLAYFFTYSYRHLRCEGDSLPGTLISVLIIAIFSYPCLFGCATGNYEVICFILTSAAVWLYTQKKFSVSSLLLAVAIAMKLTPAVFILLFIIDKKVVQLLWMGLCIFILTLTPLLLFVEDLFDGGFETYFANFQASVGMYFNLMVLSPAGNHFGHSLLNMMRAVMGEGYFPMEKIVGEYMIFAVVAAIGFSCYIAFIESKLWKKTALIVCMMNLLPYTSTDYKLLYLFIPLFLYVNEEQNNKWDPVFIVIFSLLLIPKYYFRFADDINNTSNTVINALSMLGLVFFIVIPGLKSKLAIVFQKKIMPRRGAESEFAHAGTFALPQKILKLEIGCGERPSDGYLHQDVYKMDGVQLDFVCNPWEIDLPENSLNEIIALGCIEHLRFKEVDQTLKHLRKLLKSGGALLFDVPDMKIWSDYLFKITHDQVAPFTCEHVWSTVYGWQRWPGDEHKSGWTREAITAKIVEAGYTQILEGVHIFLEKGFDRRRFHREHDAHIYIKAIK